MFPSLWGKQRNLDPFLGSCLSVSHQLSLWVMILWPNSSLSLCWCQPHLSTSLPSPTSNSCSPVSPSQPPTMIEQYFNRCASTRVLQQGTRTDFFLKKETGKFQNLVPFGPRLLLKWHDVISYCSTPNFFFVRPYHKLNWKLISSSKSNGDTSSRRRSVSSISLRLHVFQRNDSHPLPSSASLGGTTSGDTTCSSKALQTPLATGNQIEPFLRSEWVH